MTASPLSLQASLKPLLTYHRVATITNTNLLLIKVSIVIISFSTISKLPGMFKVMIYQINILLNMYHSKKKLLSSNVHLLIYGISIHQHLYQAWSVDRIIKQEQSKDWLVAIMCTYIMPTLPHIIKQRFKFCFSKE